MRENTPEVFFSSGALTTLFMCPLPQGYLGFEGPVVVDPRKNGGTSCVVSPAEMGGADQGVASDSLETPRRVVGVHTGPRI